MTDDNTENHFSHLLIGTSLPLSILSASLSQNSDNKILHIDTEENYGSHHASLTLTQLVERVGKANVCFPYFSTSSIPDQLSKLDRHYSLSLSPSLQPASSSCPSLDTLIRSNVAKYATFRLLQTTALYDDTVIPSLKNVPSSKEDIFKSTSLSLLDKRKLMKFLQFAASDYASDSQIFIPNAHKPFTTFLADQFNLSRSLISAITYGIALASSEDELTTTAMQRVKVHLGSVGRYGNSAYLVAQYGGMGDIVQGYCRASAVSGSTFVLGKRVVELSQRPEGGVVLRLDGIDEVFSADVVVGNSRMLSGLHRKEETISQSSSPKPRTRPLTMQSILILDRGLNFSTESETQTETALLIFPPGTVHKYTTTALVLGEGTFCCPKGQYVVQCTTQVDDQTSAREIHDCVKEKIMHLVKDSPVEWHSEGVQDQEFQPLFEAHWVDAEQEEEDIHVYPLLDQPLTTPIASPAHIATLFDHCTDHAQSLFYALHGVHKPPYPDPRKKSTLRHDDEYRGRGGVGPDLEERNQQDDDTTTGPLFFPVDQDRAAEEDDE